jgi:hypothetical protein
MPTFNLVDRDADVLNLEEVIGWTASKLSDLDGRFLVLPVCVKNNNILGTVKAEDMLWKACSIGTIPVFNGPVHHESPIPSKESEREHVWIHFEDDLSRLETGHRSNAAGGCRFPKGLQGTLFRRPALFADALNWLEKQLVARFQKVERSIKPR